MDRASEEKRWLESVLRWDQEPRRCWDHRSNPVFLMGLSDVREKARGGVWNAEEEEEEESLE